MSRLFRISKWTKSDILKIVTGAVVPILVAWIAAHKGSSPEIKLPGTSVTFVQNVSLIENQYQQVTRQPLRSVQV